MVASALPAMLLIQTTHTRWKRTKWYLKKISKKTIGILYYSG
jgi:hypothetical protein